MFCILNALLSAVKKPLFFFNDSPSIRRLRDALATLFGRCCWTSRFKLEIFRIHCSIQPPTLYKSMKSYQTWLENHAYLLSVYWTLFFIIKKASDTKYTASFRFCCWLLYLMTIQLYRCLHKLIDGSIAFHTYMPTSYCIPSFAKQHKS